VASEESMMSGRQTMYSTSWCGVCVRLKRGLEREGIEFDEVNIEEDPEAEKFVLDTNNGMALVPTLVLPNGEVLSNPPLPTLLEALKAA
jgi:mycoredoxin